MELSQHCEEHPLNCARCIMVKVDVSGQEGAFILLRGKSRCQGTRESCQHVVPTAIPKTFSDVANDVPGTKGYATTVKEGTRTNEYMLVEGGGASSPGATFPRQADLLRSTLWGFSIFFDVEYAITWIL